MIGEKWGSWLNQHLLEIAATMSFENEDLVAYLEQCDLKMAAFEMTKNLAGGVFETPIVQGVQLFTKLPCVETALVLAVAAPAWIPMFALTNREFATTVLAELSGSHYDAFEQSMASYDLNLKACDAIHGFLLELALKGAILIGFHRGRDQKVLLDRVNIARIERRGIVDDRTFLRHAIAASAPAFRSVADLVCVHGVDAGRERFWSSLGAEVPASAFLESEVQFNIGANANHFAALLKRVSQRDD